MAKLPLAVRTPHAGAVLATAPEGPVTLANIEAKIPIIKHDKIFNMADYI